MYRVQRLVKHSSEMVFIAATGNVDGENYRVFVLLIHSAPLGLLVTESESQATITAALALFKKLVGDDGFLGRGRMGPQIFMTDDSKAERGALGEVFQSTLLLCAFHILRAHWRYVWDSKNGVLLQQRPHVFHLVKDMMYASDPEDLDRKYRAAEGFGVHPSLVPEAAGMGTLLEAEFDDQRQ